MLNSILNIKVVNMPEEYTTSPYKLAFVALTAAVLMSATDVPDKSYSLKPTSAVGYSWEDTASGTFSLTSNTGDEIMAQIQILHEFASQIIENSENIKPEAVNMINKNFWDLLA